LNDLNGEEDDQINCFREGEQCVEGLQMLKKLHNELEDISLIGDGDEEEDFNNINEVLLESDEEFVE
jgi:hypothetical protein